jgi:hypothetical protein
MQKFPKSHDFNPPEDYFENLPEEIMSVIGSKKKTHWLAYAAAAAVFILVFGLGQSYYTAPQNNELILDQQIDLFIDSQYWTAEDVLNMSDDPDAILDDIIDEELFVADDSWTEDQQIWY